MNNDDGMKKKKKEEKKSGRNDRRTAAWTVASMDARGQHNTCSPFGRAGTAGGAPRCAHACGCDFRAAVLLRCLEAASGPVGHTGHSDKSTARVRYAYSATGWSDRGDARSENRQRRSSIHMYRNGGRPRTIPGNAVKHRPPKHRAE